MANNWKEAAKFFSGAVFVKAATTYYFLWYNVKLPLPFTGEFASHGFLMVTGLIQSVLFLVLFYIGFIRK